MKLVFYNHFGVGDLFESREFVKDWMRLCGVTEAEYAHRTMPGFFADLPGITSVPVRPEMALHDGLTFLKNGSIFSTIRPTADELWVNTWIGARNDETTPKGNYVIWPGVGCVVENLYRMHNDYLREAGLPPLPRTIIEYLPTIDYTRVDLGNLHTWLAAHRGERLVLVCNGGTGSGHASNFDMVEAIRLIGPQANTTYLFTAPSESASLNIHGFGDFIYFTDKLTQRDRREAGAYGPCDFNAISYLSRFCSVIVGRCSGPQMGTQVLENWMDSTKTLVCFTEHRNGACFVLNPAALGLKMNVVWSGATTPEAAAQVMEGVLR